MATLRHSTATKWTVLLDNGQRMTLFAESVYIDPETDALILNDNTGNLVTAFARGAWLQVTPV